MDHPLPVHHFGPDARQLACWAEELRLASADLVEETLRVRELAEAAVRKSRDRRARMAGAASSFRPPKAGAWPHRRRSRNIEVPPMSRPVRVFREAEGRYLVAQVGPEDDHPWWPAWCIDADGRVDGPRSLGDWLRSVPSDWRPAAEPLPEHIGLMARWVASIEDMAQVGVRDGRGWMPRQDRPGPGPPEP